MSQCERDHVRIVDFEKQRSIPARLWTTFVLMLMGTIMLLPYGMLDHAVYKESPWLKFTAMRLIEMVEVYVILAIVFTWYCARWFRGLYVKAERHMSWLYYLVAASIMLGFVWMGIYSAFTMLFER
jgi:hypothetical protein